MSVALIAIVCAALATLGRRLPRVGGPAELSLSELIQARLLAPKEFELVGTLVGVEVHPRISCAVGRDGDASPRSTWPAARRITTEQPSEEPHRRSVYGAAVPAVQVTSAPVFVHSN